MAVGNDHLKGLADDSQSRLEEIFVAFESSWRRGARPRIGAYLPSGPPEERRAALVELVYIDLEYAMKRDSSARIEAYLAQYTDLAADREFVLRLADREYRLRSERGTPPSIKEYAARFPDVVAKLILLLETTEDEPGDGSITHTYQHQKAPGTSSQVDDAIPTALPDTGPARYRYIRPYAKGGLGEVFVAEDSLLKRKVALKRIRPEFANDPAVRNRFFREAEITATLEHPGVAPIHELITDKGNQPWYVMRFLKGHTFRVAIEKYHRHKEDRDDATRSLEFRGLLTRFVSVCDTMAYAHRLGVVHRDLTPANVMVGEFGETIVLDWGFATVSGEVYGEDPNVSMAPSASPLDDSLMKSGKLFGTPPFMSPEQAGGHQTIVGPVSDIYCLGAILFMLLTGRPPFSGDNLQTTLQKVQEGDFPKPRALKPEVAPALEAICLKAMSLKSSDRYEDASLFAKDIARWMADEPVSAYKEPRAERFGRWARRNRRRIVTTAAAGGIALAVAGSYAAVALRRSWAAEESAVAKSNGLLGEAKKTTEIAGNDPLQWNLAVSRAKDAEEVLRAAGASKSRIAEASSLLRDYEARERAALFLHELGDARVLSAALDESGQPNQNAKIQKYDALFRAYGIDVSKLEDSAKTIRGSSLGTELVAFLDDWALDEPDTSRKYGLLALAGAADADPTTKLFRDAMTNKDTKRMLGIANKIDERVMTPTRLHFVGTALRRVREIEEASRFLLRAQEYHSGDFWINLSLAQTLGEEKTTIEEAKSYFSAAEACLQSSVAARLYYGNFLLLTVKDTQAAIGKYKHAIWLDPRSAEAHYALGYAYSIEKDTDHTLVEYRTAIECRPDYLEAQNAYVKTALSAERLREAVSFLEHQVTLYPQSASAHNGYGLALFHDPVRRKESHSEFKKGIELNPIDAAPYYHIGNIYKFEHQYEQAIASYQKAVQLNEKSPLYNYCLGEAYRLTGNVDDAIEAQMKATDLAKNFPEAHASLGRCYRSKAKFSKAKEEFDKAGLSLAPKIEQDENAAFLELEPRLEAIVKGQDAPAPRRPKVLARLCYFKGRFVDSARFWAEYKDSEEAGEKALTDAEVQEIARAEALAGFGHGEPAAEGVETSANLRELATERLISLIELYQGLPEKDSALFKFRNLWNDKDLRFTRDAKERAKLPTDEQKQWRSIWESIESEITSRASKQ